MILAQGASPGSQLTKDIKPRRGDILCRPYGAYSFIQCLFPGLAPWAINIPPLKGL
jgi:hypothetical protein